ncbi:hypothetical protein EUTSA_v10018745mg [Eutrema salsugineum]|uniref:F-box domain-containing protein n=1 Tax=Eutrema salsugineum TaxID=72664 RepID=V4KAH1_EUTSA|nr:hypothetical protein EUTSA_v10018745mg [Eutrema salsugineum]
MANTNAASNADEPRREIIPPPIPSPSWFSPLPIEIVLKILAYVPKRYYPTLSCVCKNFRYLVRSPEIHRIRSLLRKDSLYICFYDETSRPKIRKWFTSHTRKWFTFHMGENNPTENHFLVSVDLGFPYHDEFSPSTIAIGPEIFFICGSYIPLSTLWIFDSRSGVLRQGPSMIVNRRFKDVGLVGSKIYVVGGYGDDDVIEAESFDLKTQTWEPAPIPEESVRKLCALTITNDIVHCYDSRDGSCESFEVPNDEWWRTGVCVIENVLYVYYARFGLMWYDSKLMLWRVVFGLRNLNKVRSVGMAECYGKMAFLWEESRDVSSETKEIWCRLIALNRSEAGIRGTAGASKLLGNVPRGYRLEHCLSLSD